MMWQGPDLVIASLSPLPWNLHVIRNMDRTYKPVIGRCSVDVRCAKMERSPFSTGTEMSLTADFECMCRIAVYIYWSKIQLHGTNPASDS